MIQNARIRRTTLGYEDHGILTFMLILEWPGAGVGFGGYALDRPERNEDNVTIRRGSAFGMEAIRSVLEVVGVEKWEDLPGQPVRIDGGGWGEKVARIGHIMEDKWLDLSELAKVYTP
jgi:hypothetical protein